MPLDRPRPHALHILDYDQPRLWVTHNRTMCGAFVRRAEIAEHEDNATCPACLLRVENYNKAAV